MAYKRRERATPASSAGLGAASDCAFALEFPSIVAFLADEQWEDGSDREPGTLLLCLGDGQAKGWLNDRAEGQSAWLTAPTFGQLLVVLEESLALGNAPWRRGGRPSGGKQGKRP